MMPNDNKQGVIEIRIRDLAQLFDSLDPSPFHERDLDQHAEEYIVSWAREFPTDTPLRIVVYLPGDRAATADKLGLASALANHFAYQAEAARRELKELFRVGLRYLGVGVPVLLICFGASQIVRTSFGEGAIQEALGESLLLLGWVANWQPIETFLYGWLPIKRRRDLYRRLSDAKVDIQGV